MTTTPSTLRRWYLATLAGGILLLLLATLPLWLFDSASIGQWLMHALPLILLLPGVAQCRRRSLQWLGFVLLFIVALGAVQLFTPDPRHRLLGALNLGGAIVEFMLVIITTRLDIRQQQLRYQQRGAP